MLLYHCFPSIMKALQSQEGKGRFYNWETTVWVKKLSVLENISWVVSQVLTDASNWKWNSTSKTGWISKHKNAKVL